MCGAGHGVQVHDAAILSDFVAIDHAAIALTFAVE
jgi:hypothetical protein